MGVEVIKEEKDYLELEVIGEDHTLCNPIRKEIYSEEGAIAGYSIEHPLTSSPKLVVRSNKPRNSIFNAVERLKGKNKELRNKLKKI